MTPRSARGRGVRAILAGGLLALVASTVTAQAGPGDAPVLDKSSISTGWLKANTAVWAEFDKIIAPASTVAVTDTFTNTAVGGTTSVVGRGIAFVPGALIEDGRTYSATFTVSGIEGTPNTVYSKSFKLDAKTPSAPVITAPETLGLTLAEDGCDAVPGCDFNANLVLGAADVFEGTARDVRGVNGVTAATSGIQKIELRFYNVVEQVVELVPSILSGRPTDYSFKVALDQTCGSVCPLDLEPWSANASEIEDLSTGVWSMRAVAIDYAGNVSAPSKSITFVVV